MADPFIEQIKRLCQEEVTRNKWIFLPTQSMCWTLGERLLLEGCNWVNLRLVTPLQLATQAAAPWLLQQGIDPCPELLGPSLLQNLLAGLALAEPYFQNLIFQPGTAEVLWRALQEFRLAGLNSIELKRLPLTAKNSELLALFTAYEDYLKEQGLADRAHVLSYQDRVLYNAAGIGADDLVLVYPYHRWSFLENSWLQQFVSQQVLPCTVMTVPAEFSGWWPRQLREAAAPTHQFFTALRRQDEVAEIVRRMLEQQIACDQVEVAAFVEDFPLIQECLTAHGIGCTLADGLPISLTRPGQTLLNLITWLENGLSAYHLCRLLEDNLLCARPDNHRALKLLQAAQITWGREAYQRQLDILAHVSQKRLQDKSAADDQTVLHIQQLQIWLQSLLQRFAPADNQGCIQPVIWLQGLQDTLRTDFIPAGKEDVLARQALLQLLQELEMLPQTGWQVESFMTFLRQRLQHQRTLAARPRPGYVHVCQPYEVGVSGRYYGFCIGMEEGRWSASNTQDCVLYDDERQLLHPGLSLACNRTAQMLFQWRERIRIHPGLLTFSYAQRDSSGDQELLPCWLFLELAQEQCPEINNFRLLHEWLGTVVQYQPVSRQQGSIIFPLAVQARRERDSLNFSEYDGFVPAAAGLWDPRLNGKPVSVSSLTALATCPYQFFLARGLGLPKAPIALPSLDNWLNAATRGSVLHNIYASYHRSLRSNDQVSDEQRDLPYLQQLLQQELEEVGQILPPPSLTLKQNTFQTLWRDVQYFLRQEASSSRRPVAIEVAFGIETDDIEPLTDPQPVLIQLGESTLALRGRIDRIDKVSDGYAVVDYKTGRRLYTARPDAIYDRGRLLQHAVYAVVAEVLLNAAGQVRQSSYYFPTLGAQTLWNHFDYPERADLERVLQLVLSPLETGAFVPTHESTEDCRFCDFQSACESHNDDQIKNKLQHAPILQARRQLLQER